MEVRISTITMMAALLLLLLVNLSCSAAAGDVQAAVAHERGIDDDQEQPGDNVYDFSAVVTYDDGEQTLNFRLTLPSVAMTFQGTCFVGPLENWQTATFNGQLLAKVQLKLGRPRLFTFHTEPSGIGAFVLKLASYDGNLLFTATFPVIPSSPVFGSGKGSGLWVPGGLLKP